MQKIFILRQWVLTCITALILSLGIGLLHNPVVYAEEDLKKAEDKMEAFKDINVFESKQGSTPNANTNKKLNSLLILAMTVGGFVVVANILIAGMKISASASNPNLRTNGIFGLIGSVVGGWMLYKCMSIVGWFGMFYSNSKGGKEGLVKDLNSLLVILGGIGGFVMIYSLIYAGSKLSLSQNNPHARVQAFVGLAAAIIGGYIIYKSFTIAGWVGGF
ncbi:hypothetical protein [Stenotrophomonas maltophilia group sp. RNC7]|uniref:hypothetical protein n=1 Tax=Stenotrophomonas maltophilia group sp. RNC7 TaxID=3071467 RepID=UPI0027E0993F|nr:hypothetical protein [Stenotrophomonas maltophilia group sp. RNC7]MDQ4682670.1 hypothetical protein [Stenotrophomonas maltophilia group sp. RNC7]